VNWDEVLKGAKRTVRLFSRVEAGQVTPEAARSLLAGIAVDSVDRALPASTKAAIQEAFQEGRAHLERFLEDEDEDD
jgi:hypothetical protein